MKPLRIQRKRTKGWTMPKNTVYVGRPTEWGNQFDGTPTGLRRYETAIKTLIKDYSGFNIEVLKGKNLACWCPLGKPCHADILLRLAREA